MLGIFASGKFSSDELVRMLLLFTMSKTHKTELDSMADVFFYSTGNVDLNFSLEKGTLDNR